MVSGAPWNWRYPLHNASQELQSKTNQHHIKSLYNLCHILLAPNRVQWQGRGLALFLNSRALIWSLPALHFSFLIQLDEHWVFTPTIPHGIDACVQQAAVPDSPPFCISHVPTTRPQLKPASKKAEKDKLWHPVPLSGAQFGSIYSEFCIQAIKGIWAREQKSRANLLLNNSTTQGLPICS